MSETVTRSCVDHYPWVFHLFKSIVTVGSMYILIRDPAAYILELRCMVILLGYYLPSVSLTAP